MFKTVPLIFKTKLHSLLLLIKGFKALFFTNFWECLCNLLFERFSKTQNKLGKQTIEIINKQKVVYNDQTPSYATGACWVALFKNGRELHLLRPPNYRGYSRQH